MKKIFILSILIVPIMAKADNVGPAAASGTPVVATANAPYATAGVVNGDTTHVVTASYVKEAYNDAIAAVNKVNTDKQNKISIQDNGKIVSSGMGVAEFVDRVFANDFSAAEDTRVVTATAVGEALNVKRISAVTAWGNDTPSGIPLSNIIDFLN